MDGSSPFAVATDISPAEDDDTSDDAERELGGSGLTAEADAWYSRNSSSGDSDEIPRTIQDFRFEETRDDEESGAEQIAALSEQLGEKDALVAALTQQLEDAANRLDRLYRAGADRGGRSSGSTSGEAGGNRFDLNEQMARLADEWDELRAADQMAELSRKLDDLHSLLSSGDGGGGGELRHIAARGIEHTLAERGREAPGGLHAWEEMKAQLLRDGVDHDRKRAEPSEAPAIADAPSVTQDKVLEELSLDPPQPINVEGADRDALAAAVLERDLFISHLIRKLCSAPSGRYEPIDWAALRDAPEDLRERLQELEARLQELLRMEECDLSLERARLARDRAQVEQLRREIDRASHDDQVATMHSDASRSDRRWLRAFGFGRKSDERSRQNGRG